MFTGTLGSQPPQSAAHCYRMNASTLLQSNEICTKEEGFKGIRGSTLKNQGYQTHQGILEELSAFS
jgi:hypothetical protein